MDKDEVWSKFLEKIKSSDISLFTYNSIFKDLELVSLSNGVAVIKVPDIDRVYQLVTKKYCVAIEDVMNEITNDVNEIQFKYAKDIQEECVKDEKSQDTDIDKNNVQEYKYLSNFNSKYTFDTFVVGESNKLAYGTALQVAQNPGKLFNPYFLYAKSGLGKTHLMHAIGNYIVSHSDKKVLYITAEQFSNEYRSISNTKNNNISYLEAFREKYRNVDVLIIDDIQYLETKIKSQSEFTNTFNALYSDEKQIIIASDTSINDYKLLEDRLKTRFRWGLTESINPPEIELKKNIIRNKIKINNYDLDISDEIVDYIANNCGSDIRNLESAVIRIIAYKATLNIKNITLGIAHEALKEYEEKVVYNTNSISKIIDIVAKYFGLDSSMIKGKMKNKNVADARAIAMYLSTAMTEETLQRIGLEFGGRDHSTIIYSQKKISKELKTNVKLQEQIKILKDKICE